MPEITNKTKRPLSVPLPGGKKLFLGPGKTGQITPKAVEHPPLKQMVDDGELELTLADKRGTRGASGGKISPTGGPGDRSPGGVRQSGDR
jgi:hypothetical protein